MDASPFNVNPPERNVGSISGSVAKVFSLLRCKEHLPARTDLQARLEEPEKADQDARAETDEEVARFASCSEKLSSPSSRKLREQSRHSVDVPGRTPIGDRVGTKPAMRLADLNSVDILAQRGLLLKAKSLLETPERQKLAFKSHSLPMEGVDQAMQPLLPLNQQYPSLAEFEVLKTIGHGTFARVLAVRHMPSGALLALKVMKKLNILRQKQLQHVLNEKCILARINHPFIVRLHSAYQDREKLYLLMELACGGQLFTRRSLAKKQFPLETARFYIASILVALEYLHANSVIYRDLKPENLLLDSAGYLKITDLGFAKEVTSGARTFTQCGTPEYLAPEIIRKEGHGKAVDWWSMGVILFEMLVGNLPFLAVNHLALFKIILSGQFDMPNDLDKSARDLIKKLLVVDPSRRLGSGRGGAQDIKRHPFFEGFPWKDLILGKATPPRTPAFPEDGALGNFGSFAESIDDPNSPILDLASAEIIFKGF